MSRLPDYRGMPPRMILARPRRRRRLRLEVFLVPMCCAVLAWAYRHIELRRMWRDSIEPLHLDDPDGFTTLAVAGCALVAIVAMCRGLRGRSDDER